MKLREVKQLRGLIDRIKDNSVSGDQVGRELTELFCVSDNLFYKEKIRQALHWSEIYFSPRQSDRYPGGRVMVRSFLVEALGSAADEAKKKR